MKIESAIELIDIICPEHSRTSCSDDNIYNGFAIDEDGIINPKYNYRCPRCALLEIQNGRVELTESNRTKILDKFIL